MENPGITPEFQNFLAKHWPEKKYPKPYKSDAAHAEVTGYNHAQQDLNRLLTEFRILQKHSR